MSVRNLLLVSYVFPPYGGITVQRALSFAKYLPQKGIQVTVLTAANAAAPVHDPGLLNHVPPEVHIERALTLEPPFYLRKRLWALLDRRGAEPTARGSASPSGLKRTIKRVLMPDPQVLWKPLAVRAASRLIRTRRFDTVLVTAPPFSVFLIGNELKRRFPDIRLVSDFRDEWLRFYLTDFEFLNDEETRRRAEAIECETIERSDLVLSVTKSSLAEIRGRYPEQEDRKFAVVPNGFDPEAFPRAQRGWHGDAEQMLVTHIGTAYRTASPSFYLDAVDRLPEEIRSRIVTRFIGRIAETESRVFENRKSRIEVLGFLPQAEALARLQETDYLLLTMTNDFSLPGKLFEYLASGKPVLALSPANGEVDRILQETRGGWCAAHDDAAGVTKMLVEAWARRTEMRDHFEPNWAAIRRYERSRLAGELAELLRERLGR
jgi:glycosyltransferase involved in cell wall biosynthesis